MKEQIRLVHRASVFGSSMPIIGVYTCRGALGLFLVVTCVMAGLRFLLVLGCCHARRNSTTSDMSNRLVTARWHVNEQDK